MKILVIGAGGMLGHQIWKKLNAQFPGEVYGTVRKEPQLYQKYNVFDISKLIGNLDITDFVSLEREIRTLHPNWIINCVGITLRKPDLTDMERCLEINSMLPHRLALLGTFLGARLIHFSTDCVFDGKRGQYSEKDLPTAPDLYGKSKFLGETHYSNALTLRLSIIGRELEAKTELVEWFLSQKGKQIKGYSKAMYSGLTTNRVADEVFKIITRYPHLSGMYQLASEPISKFDLLHLLNEYFGTNAYIEPYDAYVADKTLNCSHYSRETGFHPPSWKEMIAEMAQDRSYGE